MKYNKLFEPLSVNGMNLKNRICMTAIHLNYCEEGNGKASEQFKQFYYTRAEGGVGLVTVGGCRFDEYGAAGKAFMSLEDDSYIDGYKEFTDGMHKRGTKVAVQLYHAGRYTHKRNLPEGKQALAPSAVFASYTHETAKEMTLDELHTIIDKWAAAAVRAKKAGFDAVEIVGSAGYLISQFLSPVTNLRTDEYGGSWENRTRFPIEVISAIRKAVGSDYPIIMRMAGNDFIPGSNTNTEAVELAKLYEKAGVDMLSVTGGWHETRVPQLPGDVPHGGFAYLAQGIKKVVSIPVIVANRIQDPYVAETVLELEQADGVGMVRTLLADPQWPNKVKAGKENELRRCVGCNQGCLASTWFGFPVKCLVNGECGYEHETKKELVTVKKNLLVVGGGPAGMTFAIAAAERGHKVTVWEKTNRLGGQLHMVATPPGKKDFLDLVDYYSNMLKRLNINVVLEKSASLDEIKKVGFDEVIIATGASPRTIEVAGNKGNIPVVTAFDVLDYKLIPGKNVVVVGGGAIGCETAQFLSEQGAINAEQLFFLTIHKAEKPERINELVNNSMRKVNIVEIAPKTGSGFDLGCAWPVMKDLNRLGVSQYTNAKIIETTYKSAIIQYVDKAGSEQKVELPCDTIVIAVGSLSENELFCSLQDSECNAYMIGDCRKIGRVLDAVREATELAYKI